MLNPLDISICWLAAGVFLALGLRERKRLRRGTASARRLQIARLVACFALAAAWITFAIWLVFAEGGHPLPAPPAAGGRETRA